MKTYHLDPQKFPKIRRNILLTYLVLWLVGLGVVYLSIGAPLFGSAWGLIPFTMLLFALAGWVALRERRKYWQAYTLRLDREKLIRSTPRSPEIQFTKKDVIRVREVRQGLIVSTQIKENALLIPKDLPGSDYNHLKKVLQSWSN
jgi:hypothetical protein